MDTIYRDNPNGGKVVGIKASYTPTILPGSSAPLKSFRSDGNIDLNKETITVRAKRSVVIGTGGSTGNVNFRRIFDPRITEEIPLAADEFSPQDASASSQQWRLGQAFGEQQIRLLIAMGF